MAAGSGDILGLGLPSSGLRINLPNFPTCHPSTNGLGRTLRTFGKNSQPDTPHKNGLALLSLLSTCHPSAILDSATLVADTLSVAVIDMQI